MGTATSGRAPAAGCGGKAQARAGPAECDILSAALARSFAVTLTLHTIFHFQRTFSAGTFAVATALTFPFAAQISRL